MAESLGSSVLDLSTDDSGLREGLDDAESTTLSKMKSIGGVVAKGAAATATALAGAGVAAVTAAAKVADYAREVDRAAQQSGMSAEKIQTVSMAMERLGVDQDTVIDGMRELNLRLGEASTEGGEVAAGFESLGVAVHDSNGDIRASSAVFDEVMTKLGELESGQERAALAAKIFGDEAGFAFQGIAGDSEALEQAMSDVSESGAVMSGEAIDQAGRFSEGWEAAKQGVLALMRDALQPLVGFMADELFPVFNDQILPILRDAADAFSEGGLAGAVQTLQEGFSGVDTGILDSISEIFDSILSFITDNVGDIVDFLLENRETFFDAAIDVFSSLVAALPEIVPQIIDAVLSMVETIVETLVAAAPLLIEGAATLVLGLVEGLTAAAPQIIQAALHVIKTLAMGLLEALPRIIRAGVELLRALVDGLLVAMPQLITFVTTDLIPQLLITIQELLPEIIKAGVEILLAIIDGLVQMIPMLVQTIIDLIPLLVETIVTLLPLLVDAGVKIFLAVLDGMLQILPRLVGMILFDLIPSLLGALIDAIPQLVSAGVDLIGGLLSGLAEAFGGRLSNWFGGLPGDVSGFFGDAGSWLIDAGEAIVDGLWDGLRSKWDDMTEWLEGKVSEITDLWPFSPAKTGPLRDKPPEEAGSNIVDLLRQGMESEIAGMSAAMTGVTATIAGSISGDDIAGGDGASLAANPYGTYIENMNVEAVDGQFDLDDIEDEVAFKGAA